MTLPVIFRNEARAEFDEAVDWYEKHCRLGAEFIARVQQVLDRIAANPKIHEVVYDNLRRAVIPRFPYSVIYREEPGQVLIIAVFHSRRDPSIWQSRT
jgi:toxin ParE1/3/4